MAGLLADRTRTRRTPFLLGLFFLLGATIILCLGRTLPALVVGRLLQGIAAGVVSTVGFALLVDTIGHDGLGQAVGWVSYAFTFGLLIGPLLGGVVYDKGGYYATYSMAFGLIGIDIVGRLVLVERKVAERWTKADAEVEAPGNNDEEKSTEGLQESMEKQKDEGKASHRALDGANGASAADNSLLQDANNSGSHPQPLNPHRPNPSPTIDQPSHTPLKKLPWRERLPPLLSLLTYPRPLATVFLTAVASLLYTSFDVVLPLHASTIFHFSSLGAGLLFLPLLIPAFTAPLVGWASDRYGSRWFVVAGFLLDAPGLILLRLVDRNTLGMKVLLCGLLVWVGLGLDLILTPMIAEFAACVDEDAERRVKARGSTIPQLPLPSPLPEDQRQQTSTLQNPKPDPENGDTLPEAPTVPTESPPSSSAPPPPPHSTAYAQAYGLFTSAYAIGMLLGPLWAGNVAQHAGWGTMALSLGVLSAGCALIAGLWVGGEIGWIRRWREGRKRRRNAAR